VREKKTVIGRYVCVCMPELWGRSLGGLIWTFILINADKTRLHRYYMCVRLRSNVLGKRPEGLFVRIQCIDFFFFLISQMLHS
jgi:hypothetical protein